MKRRLASAIVLSAVLASSAAFAQEAVAHTGDANSITDTSHHNRPTDLSILAFIPFDYGYFGIGVEGRFEIPILPDGFIPSINDSFAIEPSLGLGYYSAGDFGYHVTTIAPAVYGIWSFWFSEKFRAYGGLGLGYTIGIVSGGGSTVSASQVYVDPVVGLFYNFTPGFAFRAEIGREAVKAGVSFAF